jgi:hypothetical protein
MKQVFLSYARLNSDRARRLFKDLCADGSVKVWFDRESLLPGMRWRPAIRKAIRESHYFIALLSRKAVSQRGVRNDELRQAVDVMKEFPDGRIFLIPARLDECRMPIFEIDELSYADLFPSWKQGIAQLRKSMGLDRKGRTAGAARAAGKSEAAKGKAAPARHYRVALVDLDSGIRGLGRVARGLNRAQRLFGFGATRLRTPGPARKTHEGRPQFYIDGVPDSFYARIAPLNVDFTVCLTDRFIAFRGKNRVVYDYITSDSPVDERVMFVSHALIRDYARRAVVSYETAIAFIVTAQLVAHFFDVDYHDETRNCPMDFCDKLEDLVGGLIAGRFCPACVRRLHKNPDLEAAARAMIAWGR